MKDKSLLVNDLTSTVDIFKYNKQFIDVIVNNSVLDKIQYTNVMQLNIRYVNYTRMFLICCTSNKNIIRSLSINDCIVKCVK